MTMRFLTVAVAFPMRMLMIVLRGGMGVLALSVVVAVLGLRATRGEGSAREEHGEEARSGHRVVSGRISVKVMAASRASKASATARVSASKAALSASMASRTLISPPR